MPSRFPGFVAFGAAGVEVQRDRWKRGVGLLDGLIGEGVGEVYVERFFPPEFKAQMDEIVANVAEVAGFSFFFFCAGLVLYD